MAKKDDTYVKITKETYDKISKDYIKKRDRNLLWEFFERRQAKRFLRKLPHYHNQILLIGSAGGNTSMYLARKSDYFIESYDISTQMVKHANKRKKERGIKNCSFTQGDIRKVKPTKKYDGIYAGGMLYHIPKKDMLSVIKKFRKALGPEGVLYCNYKVGNKDELQSDPASYQGQPRAYWFYQPEEVEDIFDKAGFTTEIKPILGTLYGESFYHVWAYPK